MGRPSIEYTAEMFQRAGRHEQPARDFLLSQTNYKGDDCLIWPFSRYKNGYGRLGLGGGRTGYAHKAMCFLAHGPAPAPSYEAAHSCGKGHEGCVNPQHLRWSTHVENIADKFQHGTVLGGTRHYLAKLTEEQVHFVAQSQFKRGDISRIAREFGVSHSAIHRIRTGKGYKAEAGASR